MGQGHKPLFEFLREHAREHPDKAAIVYYGNIITYQQLDEYSDKFAQFLRDHGLRKGDKIALFMQNCPQYL
ncbi:MAG: AMP-binding protein, partial [Alicyclobacillus macrosporangiidus]|uniref:AMP-binding protein n=1 Tax=Alicyclobacillus macrosporangiidus TaxID=392015 RepID=UPI0026EA43DA